MRGVVHRLTGALTDLGYMILAASPRLRMPYRRWADRRYSTLAPLYHRRAEADPTYLAPLRVFLDHLDFSPACVVEVGAGTGAATAVLLHRYPQAVAVAIDASLQMLHQITAGVRAPVRRVAGDVFRIPVCAGAADLALVHNAPFDLQELVRILRPSGALVIVLSSARWIPSPLRDWLLLRRPPQGWRCVTERAAGPGIVWVFQSVADPKLR